MTTSAISWNAIPTLSCPTEKTTVDRYKEAELEYSVYTRNPDILANTKRNNIFHCPFNFEVCFSEFEALVAGIMGTRQIRAGAQISKGGVVLMQYHNIIIFFFFPPSLSLPSLPEVCRVSGVWCGALLSDVWNYPVSNDPHIAQWHNTSYMEHMENR